MWPGESPPVATWLSRGWKRWKLRRSTRATDMGARPRALATCNPPNPPPTITTRCDGAVWDFTGCWMLAGGSAMLAGWKRWKLRRSTRATDMGARPRALATYNPPNPPPTITTRCDGAVWDFTGCWMLAGGSAMLLGRRGAIPFRVLAYSPGFVLYFRFGRTELNHDARNSATGGGYPGRGAHRHCHPQTQRHQEEGRRRFLAGVY